MRKAFNTRADVSLDIRVPAGNIDLIASDRAETTIEVTPLGDDDGSRSAAEDSFIDMQEDGGRALVRVEVPKRGRRWLSHEPMVKVTVNSRIGADLHFEASSADVVGRGNFGSVQGKSASGDIDFESAADIELRSASGNVKVGEVDGTCKIDTASGDVSVHKIEGRTRIRSASGDVGVGKAATDIKVQTASGDVQLDAIASGQVALQSASGDMRIGVVSGATLWIDAKSLSGDTTSELDVGDDPPDIDGPHIDLQATSMSGDIHIARAAAFH